VRTAMLSLIIYFGYGAHGAPYKKTACNAMLMKAYALYFTN